MSAHPRRSALLIAGLAATLATSTTTATATAGTSKVERVSVSSAEKQVGGSGPRFLTMSTHGRFVAFDSPARGLVTGDTNGDSDVFVRDRQRGTTVRASVSTSGRQSNEASIEAAISGNGRYVAFTSGATNLIRGDTNRYTDVFVRDLVKKSTRRVSVSTSGQQGRGYSAAPTISADGRYVAFTSAAANLTKGDRNGAEDVFVRDLRRNTTSRVSVPSRGGQFTGPSATGVISDDGQRVAFISNPNHPDQFDVFLRDRTSGKTHWVTQPRRGKLVNGLTGQIAISGNGRFVSYISDASNLVDDDTNGDWDGFVWDARTGKTQRVTVGAGGQANGFSDQVSLSRDGRYVGFASTADNLVEDDTNGHGDAFVRDLRTGRTVRISVNGTEQANGPSGPDYAPQVTLADDGRHAAFVSEATNLTARADTNSAPDVFAWDSSPR